MKACEANQGSSGSSSNIIMIKISSFFFESKPKYFQNVWRNKKKTKKQSFIFSLSDSKNRSNNTDFQALFLKNETQAHKQQNKWE